MISATKILLYSVLGLYFGHHFIHAQDENNEIQTGITLLSWSGTVRNEIKLQMPDELIPVDIFPTSRSRVIPYRGPNPITFVRKTGSGEHAQITTVAKAYIPEDLNRALLVFVKNGEQNREQYRIVVLDDSFETSPVNSYRFLNWTDKRIAAKLGDEIFTMEAGKSETISYSEQDATHVPMQMIEFSENGHRPLFSSRWYREPGIRTQILLLPSPEGGRQNIDIKIIADYRNEGKP